MLNLRVKEEIKIWIYYQLIKLCEEENQQITYEDVNSVVIDMLHENNKHDPKELFKKTI
jgi:hypothetical protein